MTSLSSSRAVRASRPAATRKAACGAALLVLLALTGCSASGDDAASSSTAGAPTPQPGDTPDDPGSQGTGGEGVTSTDEPTETESSAAAGDLTCDQVADVAGAFLADLELSADDSGPTADGVECVWVTADVAAATTDLAGYAGIGITVDSTPWSAEEMSSLGSLGTPVDDPRLAAVDGAAVLLGEADLSSQLSTAPFMLLLPDRTVTIVSVGLAVSSEQALPETTYGGALDVALAIHDRLL